MRNYSKIINKLEKISISQNISSKWHAYSETTGIEKYTLNRPNQSKSEVKWSNSVKPTWSWSVLGGKQIWFGLGRSSSDPVQQDHVRLLTASRSWEQRRGCPAVFKGWVWSARRWQSWWRGWQPVGMVGGGRNLTKKVGRRRRWMFYGVPVNGSAAAPRKCRNQLKRWGWRWSWGRRR